MISTTETFSRMLAVASFIWLFVAADAANANVLQLDGWNSVGRGETAIFEEKVSSSFNDSLAFTFPGGSVGQEITRPSVQLSHGNNLADAAGQTGSSSPLNFLGSSTPENFPFRGSGSSSSGTGAYGGTMIVNPVPEPQTYAMLIIGLCLVAFSARRRRGDSDY